MNKEDVVRLDNAARFAQGRLDRVIQVRHFEQQCGKEHPYLRYEVEMLGQSLSDYDDLAKQLGGPPLMTERTDQLEGEPDLGGGMLRTVYRLLAHRIQGAQPVVRAGIPVDVPDDNDAIEAMFKDYREQLAREAQMRPDRRSSMSEQLVRDLGIEGRQIVKPQPTRIGVISGTGNAFGVIRSAGMRPSNFEGTVGSCAPPPLSTFLDGIVRSLEAGAFGPALLSALVVPDACGAVEYPDVPRSEKRRRNKYRYVSWYDRFVEPVVEGEFTFGGEAAWDVRNGMIHETGLRFTKFGYDRVIFLPPGDVEIAAGFLRETGPNKESAFALDLRQYVGRLIDAAKSWLAYIGDDHEKQERLKSLIQLRPEGLSPFFVGVPVLY